MMLDQKFIDEASRLFKEKERLTHYVKALSKPNWLELRIMGSHMALAKSDSLLATMRPEDFERLAELRIEEIDERLQEMGIQS